MSNKYIAYSLHTLVIAVWLIVMLLLPGLFWIFICFVGLMVNTSFKLNCGGFYYNDRENISVEIIEVGPKTVKR